MRTGGTTILGTPLVPTDHRPGGGVSQGWNLHLSSPAQIGGGPRDRHSFMEKIHVISDVFTHWINMVFHLFIYCSFFGDGVPF